MCRRPDAGAHAVRARRGDEAAVGAMFFGAGWSLMFPSLALLVVNEAGEARRAEALGTYTAFFDLGFGLGAPLVGAIAALAGYPAAFWASAAFALAGGLVTAAGSDRVRARVGAAAHEVPPG